MLDPLQKQRAMVEKYPDSELARFNLGKAFYERAEYQAAAAEFSWAVLRKPDWMTAQILLGKTRIGLGDQSGARAAFKAALNLAISQKHEGPQLELEALLSQLN